MQTNNLRMLGWVALAALVQACGGPKSSSTSGPEQGPVPTSRMTIKLTVEANDSNTAVARANLNDGRTLATSYRLDGGDYFRTCVNGVCRNMADNDSILEPDYIARFDYQPGVEYVVSFYRNQDRNAPDSRVILPPAFTIVTPANGQNVTDGETVVVSWSPTGAPARVGMTHSTECTLVGGALSVSSGTLGDDADGDGRESVRIDPILNFVRSSGSGAISRCRIDIKVRHELQGRVDPAFRNGTALGIVSRTVRLDYIPR